MVPLASSFAHPVLLFDGVCNLCNAAVNFVIDRDPEAHFRFASLQSEAAAQLLAPHGLSTDDLDSVVLVADGQAYRRSRAVLETLRRLGGPWSWLYALVVLPRPVRDWLYEQVAVRRYRLFGKRDVCRVPTPDLQARFLG